MMDSETLGTLLTSIGVEVTRIGEKEISARCPVHVMRTGHEDHSPSWSMNISSGLWICYACSAAGSLPYLVSVLSGDSYTEETVQSLLMNAAVSKLSAKPVPIASVDEQDPAPSWLDLYRFDFPPSSYLMHRQIDEDAARRYGLRWDPERKAIVVPIVSPDRDLMGWQIKGRNFFLNYPTGVKKSETLFGIEQFTAKTAILVESPLDVVRYASAFIGYQALASFGAHVSDRQIQLLGSVADKIIIAMDNDKAGVESCIKMYAKLPQVRKGVYFLSYEHTKAKDIGDMTDDEVETAVANASMFAPWMQSHDFHRNALSLSRRGKGPYGRAGANARGNGHGRRQDRYVPRSNRGTARRWRG